TTVKRCVSVRTGLHGIRAEKHALFRGGAALAPAFVLGLLAALAHLAPAPVAALGRVEEEPAAAIAGALLETKRRRAIEQLHRFGHRDVADGGEVGRAPAPAHDAVLIDLEGGGVVGVG